jgi:hypothetical protein
MKRILTLLLIATVATISCKKEDGKVNAKGTLTATVSIQDPVTKQWKDEAFTANSVVTTKSGNNYTVTATDGSKNTFTLKLNNITGAGTFPIAEGTLVKGGKTYKSVAAGQITITAASANSLTASSFISEGVDWSIWNGKVDATF